MVSIFEFEDYKAFARRYIQAMPRKGHGEMAHIAKSLRMHTTRVSQVFNGKVELSLEQAYALCRHFGLSPLESEYFLSLVSYARAGTKELKDMQLTLLTQIRSRAKMLVHRVPRDKVLSSEQKAVFYSNWSYSAIRLAASIQDLGTIDAIAEHFEMSRERVREIMDFLLNTGLCIEEDGMFQMGAKTTHIERSSPHVLQHHTNWRIKAMARHESMEEDEFAYTCPVSINSKDFSIIREMLSRTIQTFLKTVTASDPPEEVACLNIDWFKVNTKTKR